MAAAAPKCRKNRQQQLKQQKCRYTKTKKPTSAKRPPKKRPQLENRILKKAHKN
jgi:hypothetical protein